MKIELEKLQKFRLPLNFFQIRKILLGLITIAFLGAIITSYDGSIQWYKLRNSYGEIAMAMFLFVIYISLLMKTFPKFMIFKQLLPFRKHVGVALFILVLAHAVAHFIARSALLDFNKIVELSFSSSWKILMGTLAFIILVPLTITSTTWAINKMGTKAWKLLHKTTHIAFLFATIHVAFHDYPEVEYGAILLYIIYIAGYMRLLIKRRNA